MVTINEKNQSHRFWFCVLNHPENVFGNIEPYDMIIETSKLWQTKDSRGCAINYEISDTKTPHMHIVLYDSSKCRFSAIKKIFPTIHIEPMFGTKADAFEYINKTGRFEEKSHTLIIQPQYFGNIKTNSQGARNDIHGIEELIEAGYTPNQIMDMNFHYRKFEKMIRSAFFSKRSKTIPSKRDVTVYWHTGESGSGKSYTYVSLVEEYGEENVYLLTDYETGGLDMYCAESILFMDEFKGNMRFQALLNYLDGYKIQIHCRYANAMALWNTVHITSIYPPDEVYQFMIDAEGRDKQRDRIQQLLRRINTIVYHYKENGEYKQYSIPMSEYIDYDNLKHRALGQLDKDGFLSLNEKDNPFIEKEK